MVDIDANRSIRHYLCMANAPLQTLFCCQEACLKKLRNILYHCFFLIQISSGDFGYHGNSGQWIRDFKATWFCVGCFAAKRFFFCSFVVSMDILTSTQLTKLIKQITETGEWDLDKDSLKVKSRTLVLIKKGNGNIVFCSFSRSPLFFT